MKQQDIKKLIGHFESLSYDSDNGYVSGLSDYASDDEIDSTESPVNKLDFHPSNHFPSAESLSRNEIHKIRDPTQKCDEFRIEIGNLYKENSRLQNENCELQETNRICELEYRNLNCNTGSLQCEIKKKV